MNTTTRTALLAPALAAALLLTACGSDEPEVSPSDITIDDAWVREPADGQTRAAGYGTITNGSDEAITLVAATAPIDGTFEVHETSVGDDGAMAMSEKEGGFEIAAGESFTLEPGGPHIMMLDIDPADFDGPIDLTFVFDSVEVETTADLREIGAGDAMEMDEMDHGGDEMEMDEN